MPTWRIFCRRALNHTNTPSRPATPASFPKRDLIVVNGLNLEGWLPKFLRSAPEARERVVTVSAGLKPHSLRANIITAIQITNTRSTPIHTSGSTRNSPRTA